LLLPPAAPPQKLFNSRTCPARRPFLTPPPPPGN
jgi:hypothetical protein